MKRSEVQGINSRIQLPRGRYGVQCVEETLETAKSGSIMLKRTFQLVCDSARSGTIVIDGDSYDIAGTQLRPLYRVFKVKNEDGTWNDAKTQKCVDMAVDELFSCGLIDNKKTFEVDENNPPMMMKGKVFWNIPSCKGVQQRKSPTAEQARRNQEGDPILDDNGKPIISYPIELGQFYGAANGVEPMPF